MLHFFAQLIQTATPVAPEPQTGLARSSLAQWAGAVATFSAVLVALFKDQLLHRFRKPKLTIRILPEPPDCVIATMHSATWDGKAYWLRIWVQNEGKERAEQVQVFVANVYKQGKANERFDPVPGFMPMNLRWSNGRDWKNPEIFAPGISPKPLGKHCDLCSISDPANPVDEVKGFKGRCVPSLVLESQPNSGVHRLPPADYIIELIVGAANASPITKYVRLNIEGGWSPSLDVMFKDHLSVEIVPKPSEIPEQD
jgi:hypothetical protein